MLRPNIVCLTAVLFLLAPSRALQATTSCAESQSFIGFSADQSKAYWEEVIGGECVSGKALHLYDFRSGKDIVLAKCDDEEWDDEENAVNAKQKRDDYLKKLNEIKKSSKSPAEALLFCEGEAVFVHKDSYLTGMENEPKGYLNKKYDRWFVVSESCNIGDSAVIGGRCDYNGVYVFKKEACREAHFKFSFKSYPVKEIYSDGPKEINWKSHPRAKLFRTNLEEGLQHYRPDFAGHYRVVKWGCGSPCAEIALIDEKTGNVFFAPFFSRIGESYRVDSRLFIVNPDPSPLFDTEYYLWDGNKFVELETDHLVSNADGSPKLPYIQYEMCEGESQMGRCTPIRKGIYESEKPLSVYAKSLDKKPVATIGKNQPFEALTWALYTVKTDACTILEGDEEFKKGEKYWTLSYAGEGFDKVWYNNGLHHYANRDENAECSGEYLSQYWTKIKYKEKIYWWVAPEECATSSPLGACPYIQYINPEPSQK